MRPALCASFHAPLSLPEALPMVCQAGFSVISLTGEGPGCTYLTDEGIEEIGTLLDAWGAEVDSLHSPYPKADRLFSLCDADREQAIRLCQRALDAAARLGARAVVIHLIQPYGIPDGTARRRMIEAGRRSVSLLASHAAARTVRLAIENGQEEAYDELVCEFLEEFGGDTVGLCYDTGHEHVQGSVSLLESQAEHLAVLHIHDNAGTDSHLLPYEGTIDWDRFCTVLSSFDFTGAIHLESSTRRSAFREPATFLTEAWERLARIQAGISRAASSSHRG